MNMDEYELKKAAFDVWFWEGRKEKRSVLIEHIV